MKYYGYSVKEVLTGQFGKNAMEVMRGEKVERSEEEWTVAQKWQWADREILALFLDERFLFRTEIEDDYIAYFYQEREQQCVFLLFINEQKEGPCVIDVAYARELVEKWAAAGYEAKIASCSVVSGWELYVYAPVENFGQFLLVFDTHSCWPSFYKKVAEVSATQDIREYECLFEPTVCLTTGDRKEKQTLDTGIEAVMKFFRDNGPAVVCYQESVCKGLYCRHLTAGNKLIDIRINVRNLIAEIQMADRTAKSEIPCDLGAEGSSRINRVPRLESVRGLSIEQLHGYAVQLTYADDTIRNYYLYSFDTRDIPFSMEAEGFMWSEDVLNSVFVENNGIRFSNGYSVPAHVLFYRSYRQVQAVCSKAKVCTKRLKPLFSLPLHEFKDHFQSKLYWGTPGECYGPAEALLSAEGRRVTDASFLGMWSDKKGWRVCPESTKQIGLLREDGSWFAPPIYEGIENDRDDIAIAKRKAEGETQQFLLTVEGEEISFPYRIDPDCLDGDLCRFNAATEPVEAPLPGYCWDYDDDDVSAGNWGYIDCHGKVVIEPQYVYAKRFDNWFNGEPAAVARLVEGKLYWGAIDKTGREVIPCIYESLYTRWGDAYAYRLHGNNLYGVMTLDGNVLAEPQFSYFEEYDEAHGMLTVGKNESAMGVYSLKQQRMIIPEKYDCVDYGAHIMKCEIQYTIRERSFTYEGEELDFSQYDSVSEQENGLLMTWKDEKCGYITLDGAVVVPNILWSGGDNMLELYRKGYVISGEKNRLGLSTVDGRNIVPEVYDEISVEDSFVIASHNTDTGWNICDTLYTYDGAEMLEGVYRRAKYDERTHRLTVDTPYGTEYFQVLPERDFVSTLTSAGC